ncbi:MAG: formylglycine-generating enzyme family protein, partial [Anaerolineae bacterium]|nr:formylglycine-generating enzyme family protein [Anaerolineae bacterium]
KGYGLAAAERLADVRNEWARNADYLNIVQMAANPALHKGALALWRVFVSKYGTDYDPEGLAALLTESPPALVTRSREETSAPVKESDIPQSAEEHPSTSVGKRTWVAGELVTALMINEHLREFSGKRNGDWEPVVGTFADLEIPDMPFCLVPTGTFNMGSDDGHYKDETPVHPQTIAQPYWIAQYPVVNAQWALAVKARAVKQPYDVGDALKWYRDPKMADVPVVGVDWFMARDFAAWLGCRLPSEREWEYAARGVEGLRYSWGNDWDADMPIWGNNIRSKPALVTTKPEGKSWVDARHMIGNVWEWTGSLYQPYPYVPGDDRERDTGDRTDVRRVLRGGSWRDIDPGYLRAACRLSDTPDYRGGIRGIRLARSIK